MSSINATSSIHSTAIRRIIYAWLLSFGPHAYKLFSLGAAGYKWDNTIGRTNMTRDSKAMGIREEQFARAKRADAAHQNGNESFPLFVAGVLSAIVAGVDPSAIDSATKRYLILRVIYNIMFIMGGGEGLALGRTLVWGSSVWTNLALVRKASAVIATKAVL